MALNPAQQDHRQVTKIGGPSLVTKRDLKRQQAMRNTTTGKTGYSMVTYCPFCPSKKPSHPQFDVKVTASKRKTARCPNGHTWRVV